MRLNKLILGLALSFFSYITFSYSMMNNEATLWNKLPKYSTRSSNEFGKDFADNSYDNKLILIPAMLFATDQYFQPLSDQVINFALKGPQMSVFPLKWGYGKQKSYFLKKAKLILKISLFKNKAVKPVLSSLEVHKLKPYATYMLTVLD